MKKAKKAKKATRKTSKKAVKKGHKKALVKKPAAPKVNWEPIVVKRHRLYCRACGARLMLKGSQELGVCRACAKFCLSCGQRKDHVGTYGVCMRCVGVINNEVMLCGKHKAPPVALPVENAPPPVQVNCVACGDPATKKFEGREYCDDCYAEKEIEAGNDE